MVFCRLPKLYRPWWLYLPFIFPPFLRYGMFLADHSAQRCYFSTVHLIFFCWLWLKLLPTGCENWKASLVTQEAPQIVTRPHGAFADNTGIKVDFRPLGIQVEPPLLREFRRQKVWHTGTRLLFLTSPQCRWSLLPLVQRAQDWDAARCRYFCISRRAIKPPVAVHRNPKKFLQPTTADLLDIIKTQDGKYLFPCSDIRKNDIPIIYGQWTLFSSLLSHRTVAANLSDSKEVFYDVLVSLAHRAYPLFMRKLPTFKQNNARIATFGETTARPYWCLGLVWILKHRCPMLPSMIGALGVVHSESE